MISSQASDLLLPRACNAQLPAELYYPICAQVSSRRDLYTLATSSSVLQRPAEAALHHKISLESRKCGRRFLTAMKECPRFLPLVRDLRLELSFVHDDDKIYWEDMREVFGRLIGLDALYIDDGWDFPLSWVLSTLAVNQLFLLRCAFILDENLLDVFRMQSTLVDLTWTGTLISLPTFTSHLKDDEFDEQLSATGTDPDEHLITSIRHLITYSMLPHLKSLHTDSLAIARVLVPGRAIKHIWVRGASFTAAVSSDYIYRHLSSSTTSSLSLSSHSSPPIQLASPQVNLSPAERTTYLCRTLRDFSRSTGPVLSLRMALDMPQPALLEVLECISTELPHLRALGFLPSNVLEPPNDAGKSESPVLSAPVIQLPQFPDLHTLCLWSTPSRRAFTALTESYSSTLPSLRTLACLHFSPAFEWLCLPIDPTSPGPATEIPANDESAYRGGIIWQHEHDVGDSDGNLPTTEKKRFRRRLTAVHDPENLLWRNV